MYRLHEWDEARRGSVGISCDKEGAYFGEHPLVAPEAAAAGTRYRVRPAAEINSVLTAGFGAPFDIAPSYPALEQVAKLLNDGDVGRAQIVALQLRFPELISDEAVERQRKASRLVRFNPNHYPPGPKGGQFAPNLATGGVSAPASPASPHVNLKSDPGKAVRLPKGGRVRDANSLTGFLMSPTANLQPVADAGRKAGDAYRIAAIANQGIAEGYLFEEIGRHVGTCGAFDYQRSCGLTGIEQHRQFRDVSNFNVGLYMQQTGVFTQEETLDIAGRFAHMASSNRRPDKPYGLDPRTAAWIAEGYKAGASKVFDRAPSE